MNTTKIHEWTGPTGVKFRDIAEPSGTYYRDTTPRPVIDALERARQNGARVRLFLGDSKTGKCWHEENDVCGTIGRSMGPIKVPLLIANSRSTGGGAILCDCIVRLLVNGQEAYRHPKFDNGVFTIREISPTDACGNLTLRSKGYTHAVEINGETHANFKSLAKAQRWVEFMEGRRLSK